VAVARLAELRRRIYQPAASAAGVTGDMRPYRLRGSLVSLLLWEGRSLTYVAEQAGHSVATLARHYAGVLRELESQPKQPAADVIRSAREAARRSPHAGEHVMMESARPSKKPATAGFCLLWAILGSKEDPGMS